MRIGTDCNYPGGILLFMATVPMHRSTGVNFCHHAPDQRRIRGGGGTDGAPPRGLRVDDAAVDQPGALALHVIPLVPVDGRGPALSSPPPPSRGGGRNLKEGGTGGGHPLGGPGFRRPHGSRGTVPTHPDAWVAGWPLSTSPRSFIHSNYHRNITESGGGGQGDAPPCWGILPAFFFAAQSSIKKNTENWK